MHENSVHVMCTTVGVSAHKKWVLKSHFMVLPDNCYPRKIMGYHSSTADMNFLLCDIALKLRPCEKFRADLCTSSLLKAIKNQSSLPKKKLIFKLSEVQKCLLENFNMVSTLVAAM